METPPKNDVTKGVTSPSTDEATLPDFFGDECLNALRSKYLNLKKYFLLNIMDINNSNNDKYRKKIKSVVEHIVQTLLEHDQEFVLRNWKPQQAYAGWKKRDGIYQLYLPAFTLYLEEVKNSKAYAAAKEEIQQDLMSKELTDKIKVGIEIECVASEDNPGFAEKYSEDEYQSIYTIPEFKKLIKTMKKFMSTPADDETFLEKRKKETIKGMSGRIRNGDEKKGNKR